MEFEVLDQVGNRQDGRLIHWQLAAREQRLCIGHPGNRYFLICPPAADLEDEAGRHSEGAMTYKTVMVGLALGKPNDARLEVAAQLAERFGVRVIGVAAALPGRILPRRGGGQRCVAAAS